LYQAYAGGLVRTFYSATNICWFLRKRCKQDQLTVFLIKIYCFTYGIRSVSQLQQWSQANKTALYFFYTLSFTFFNINYLLLHL